MSSTLLRIKPRTHGVLSIALTETVGGTEQAVTSATVTADVYNAQGKQIAVDVVMNHAGSGVYTLVILPAYSEDGDRGVEGTFVAEVKAVVGSSTFTERFLYDVVWE